MSCPALFLALPVPNFSRPVHDYFHAVRFAGFIATLIAARLNFAHDLV